MIRCEKKRFEILWVVDKFEMGWGCRFGLFAYALAYKVRRVELGGWGAIDFYTTKNRHFDPTPLSTIRV